MGRDSQVNDTAILKAVEKKQRLAKRKARQEAEEQRLIDEGAGPRQAKLAALDMDWDQVVNNRATRRQKRAVGSDEPKSRKKAKTGEVSEDSEREEPRVLTKAPARASKTRKVVVEPESTSSSECDDGDEDNSSSGSEDNEEISDRDLITGKVKVICAGDLFNSDENIVSARPQPGLSKDSSRSSGLSTTDTRDSISQKRSKTYSKREEVFMQERAQVVVTQQPAPAKFKPRQSRAGEPRPPSPLSFASDNDEDTVVFKTKRGDRFASNAELLWPSKIRIVFNNGLKIRQQNTVIKTLIAETISRCELHMIREDAFPETGRREEFRYAMAKEAIKALKSGVSTDFREAYHRAKKDAAFVHKIGEVAVDRLAHHRNDLRTAATTRIGTYQIGFGEVCKQRVAALLKGYAFLYSGHWATGQEGEHWVIESRTTYLNPAIVETLKSSWFKSERTLGNQHHNLYVSSVPEDTDKKEFTIPLVALAATSVHSALSSWRNGLSSVKPEQFKGEIVGPTYKTFVSSLRNFRASKPLEFHHVMALLYTAVCGTRSENSSGPTVEDDPFLLFDL